jgi:hypothetical protein
MGRCWPVGLIVGTLALVACTAAPERERRAPEARAAAPTVGATSTLPVTAIGAIHPVAGWHVRGHVRAQPRPPGASPGFQVEVQAPPPELARPDGGPNLIWHIGAGRCDPRASGPVVVWDRIFYLLTPPASGPGRQAFVMPLVPAWAEGEFEWRNRPLILAAYINGGGPLVACAALPG